MVDVVVMMVVLVVAGELLQVEYNLLLIHVNDND